MDAGICVQKYAEKNMLQHAIINSEIEGRERVIGGVIQVNSGGVCVCLCLCLCNCCFVAVFARLCWFRSNPPLFSPSAAMCLVFLFVFVFVFLAVQDSSIGDLVTHSVSQ